MSETEPGSAAWDALLACVPGAGPFHLPAFRRALLESDPGLRDLTLWIADGDDIRAALPVVARRRLVLSRVASLPYGTPGGAWLREPGDRDAAAALYAEFARRFARPWTLCVVADHGDAGLGDTIRRHWPGARARAEETHLLELPASEEELERGFAHRTRKSRRRVAGAGVRVEPAGPEAVSEFAALQRNEAAARGQRVVYPEALLRAGARQGWLRVHRAVRGEETLAVTAIAEGCGTWFAWLVSFASAARAVPTGELLFGDLLHDAVRRGLKRADLGNSGGRAGTRFFKEGFGGRPVGYRVWRSGPRAGGGS
ncbi:MAG: GNAT family N-acetyltransferase [Candidatus Eisenbacteria bacterium]|nr:GNAT family N-acetyltransferase [Candidatus Eisenbacteria bacterium]